MVDGPVERSHGAQVVGVFAHPLTLLCLGGWILNDHVLKATHGGLLTGKLSDIFGLAVFPLILASLTPAAPARRIDGAIACTAAFFISINVFTAANEVVLVALRLLVSNPQLTPDATDLFTLPALAVARWLWNHPIDVTPGQVRQLGWTSFALACLATTATSEPDTVSADAITRVEVDEAGDFLALHQNVIFEETYSDEEPGDPNPPIGLPAGFNSTVYRSADGRSWQPTTIDPNTVEWQQTLDTCVGDRCVQVSGNLFDRGTIGSPGVGVVFEPIETPPDCHDRRFLRPSSGSICYVRSTPGPLDIATSEQTIVVALGTEGVAVHDGATWTQRNVDTARPRGWVSRNLMTLLTIGLVALLWCFALLGVAVYRRRSKPALVVPPPPPAAASLTTPPPPVPENGETPGP